MFVHHSSNKQKLGSLHLSLQIINGFNLVYGNKDRTEDVNNVSYC